MRWAIVYADKTVFTHEDGAPEDAPGGGVLGIGQEDTLVGLAVHRGEDWYVFGEQYGGWYGLDDFGLAQYLARPGLKIVKMGESVRTDVFRDVLGELQTGGHLPHKSARYPWEEF